LPKEVIDALPEAETVPDGAAKTDYLLSVLGSREGLEMNRAFSKIKSPETRKAFVEFVKTLT